MYKLEEAMNLRAASHMFEDIATPMCGGKLAWQQQEGNPLQDGDTMWLLHQGLETGNPWPSSYSRQLKSYHSLLKCTLLLQCHVCRASCLQYQFLFALPGPPQAPITGWYRFVP